MAHVQHPTAERIVLEVDDSALQGWLDEGWKQADASTESEAIEPETPLTLTQGAENGGDADPVSPDTTTRGRRATTEKEA